MFHEFTVLFLSIIGGLFFQSVTVNAFSSPSPDFLLGIDGASVTVAHEHICVLEQKTGEGIGGRAQCWGYADKSGRSDAPKDMDFVQIVAGYTFTCGMTVEQTVYCWGSIKGQIPGLYEQITAAGFGKFGCGVMTDGKINCWGYAKAINHMPQDLDVRFVQVSCSKNHCCALDDNAYPHCWSSSKLGETKPPLISYEQYTAGQGGLVLSDSSSSSSSRVEDDTSTGTADADASVAKMQFRQISVGESYSCGITLHGANLYCWVDESKTPIFAHGPYRQVSSGRKGVCAITGTIDDVSFAHPAAAASTAAAAEEQLASTLRRQQEQAKASLPSRLGGGDAGDSSSDEDIDFEKEQDKAYGVDSTEEVAAAAAGRGAANAFVGVTSAGNYTRDQDLLECWGTAKSMVGADATDYQWDQISVGSSHICGVTMDSELKCWGYSLPPEYQAHPAKYIVA